MDAGTGEVLQVLCCHSAIAIEAAFSPDATRAASVADDHLALVWDVASGRRAAEMRGHTDTVVDPSFDRSGDLLASASLDGTARLWDPATGRQQLTLLQSASVSSIAFSADARHLAAAAEDGSMRVSTLDIDQLVDLAMARMTRPRVQPSG